MRRVIPPNTTDPATNPQQPISHQPTAFLATGGKAAGLVKGHTGTLHTCCLICTRHVPQGIVESNNHYLREDIGTAKCSPTIAPPDQQDLNSSSHHCQQKPFTIQSLPTCCCCHAAYECHANGPTNCEIKADYCNPPPSMFQVSLAFSSTPYLLATNKGPLFVSVLGVLKIMHCRLVKS